MSLDPRGYYRSLEVHTSATSETIRIAYRTLAKQMHPDMNRGQDTTAIFQRINEAYSVLSDPAQRKEYDDTGQPVAQTIRHSAVASRQTVPRVEPYYCADCGCTSATLRHVQYTQVVGFIVGAHRTNVWGIFCEKCAAIRLRKASFITGAFGWLSIKGMVYSTHALFRNLTGGKQAASINLEVCARQAIYFAERGEWPAAKIAALAAIAFGDSIWWSEEAKLRASELRPMLQGILLHS